MRTSLAALELILEGVARVGNPCQKRHAASKEGSERLEMPQIFGGEKFGRAREGEEWT